MFKTNSIGIIISAILLLALAIKFFWNFKSQSILPKKYFIPSKHKIFQIFFFGTIFFTLLLPLQIQILQSQTVVNQKRIPVQIIFDVSLSMAADDIQPSRFSAAKNAVSDIISSLDGYYTSLIAFSKIPFIRIPFSNDSQAILHKRNETNLGDFPAVQEFVGTAIGDALLLGVQNLEQFSDTDFEAGIIVLVTDGDSAEGTDPDQAISILQKKGIPVFVFAIGEQNFLIGIDQDGASIKAKVDLELLQKIADQTGGQFFRILEAKSFQNTMSQIIASIKKTEELEIQNKYFPLNRIFIVFLIFNLIGLFYTKTKKNGQ